MDNKIHKNTREKVPIQLTEVDFTPIIVASIFGLIVLVIFLILRRRSTGRRDILLTGLSESGKSCIFMQLMYKKFPDTFTSMTENVAEYKAGILSARLVDIPGHYRVRDKYIDQYKRKAKAIIFIVDSVTVQKDVRDVADALYTLLSDRAIQSCPLLVLCNKQDLTTAKSAQVIRNILEKELNIVRDTRSRKLKTVGVDDDESKSFYLGKEGKDFEFTQLPQNIQFCECSAKDNELSHLSDWMDKMM